MRSRPTSSRIDGATVAEVFEIPTERPGVLVTIVGFDGSGKTTQIDALAARLRSAGREVVTTRQPSDWYRHLPDVRSFHDAGGSVDNAHILALLAAADRRRHVAQIIVPALDRGAVVLCDRYVYATYGVFVHRGVSAGFLTTINQGIPRPDLAFYLRMTPDQLLARLRDRDGDKLQFEERSRARIESIIRTYEEMGTELIGIDGAQPTEQVTETMLEMLDPAICSTPVGQAN